MPRTKADAPKAAATRKPRGAKTVEATRAVKPARKPYPSHDERIAMADVQIARLQKLKASREALVAKTEAKLCVRKAALEKSTAALKRVTDRKARIEIIRARRPGML